MPVGRVSPADGGNLVFDAERPLGNRSIPSGRLAMTLDFTFRKDRRLKAECARRDQPVPEVRLPGC